MMLQALSAWLRAVTRWWVAALAMLVFLLFSILVLPRQSERTVSASEEAGSPDLRLTYTPEWLHSLAEDYGEAGRAAYVRARFTFDLVSPLVYGFFLVTTLSWLSPRVFRPGSPWQLANLAPVLGVGFDFLENLSTSLVMLRHPLRTPVVDALAPLFTLLKWDFVAASIALLAGGLIYGIGGWLRGRLPA